jgi:ATP-dependent DNA helicase RecQ
VIFWYDWNQYIIQPINQGFVKLHFINKQNKPHHISPEVLFEGDKVQLTTVQKIPLKNRTKEPKANLHNSFEKLRKLRYEISKEESVPAYVIFSDALYAKWKQKTNERYRIDH